MMRMRSVLVATAAVTVLLSNASRADPGRDYSLTETRRIAYDYANCVINRPRNAVAASDALLSNADNQTIRMKYTSLIDGDCLVRTIHGGGRMRFPADLYRYALADALVARELSAVPVQDLSAVPALPRRKLPDAPAPLGADASGKERARYKDALKEFNDAQSVQILDKYGECVVRTNPAAAKALLVTKPETPAETDSFGALRDALAECAPEGMTITFGKLVLRGTIAVNYYRLMQAAHPVSVR